MKIIRETQFGGRIKTIFYRKQKTFKQHKKQLSRIFHLSLNIILSGIHESRTHRVADGFMHIIHP